LASSFPARGFAFLKSAALDDGVPHRSIANSRPSALCARSGHLAGEDVRHRRKVSGDVATDAE
jgi:hypothetical protein